MEPLDQALPNPNDATDDGVGDDLAIYVGRERVVRSRVGGVENHKVGKLPAGLGST